MPVSSITLAISPPSASISLTMWPLATPPIAGLHDICATMSRLPVSTSTRAPIRAAASEASQPAWPAPTTITSYASGYSNVMDGHGVTCRSTRGEGSRGLVGRRRRLVGRRAPPAALAAGIVAVLLPGRELVDVEGQPHHELAGVKLIGRLAVVPRDRLDLGRAATIEHVALGPEVLGLVDLE